MPRVTAAPLPAVEQPIAVIGTLAGLIASTTSRVPSVQPLSTRTIAEDHRWVSR